MKTSPRFVRSHAEILDRDGNVLAGAEIEYLKLDTARVTGADCHEELCYLLEDGVMEID